MSDLSFQEREGIRPFTSTCPPDQRRVDLFQNKDIGLIRVIEDGVVDCQQDRLGDAGFSPAKLREDVSLRAGPLGDDLMRLMKEAAASACMPVIQSILTKLFSKKEIKSETKKDPVIIKTNTNEPRVLDSQLLEIDLTYLNPFPMTDESTLSNKDDTAGHPREVIDKSTQPLVVNETHGPTSQVSLSAQAESPLKAPNDLSAKISNANLKVGTSKSITGTEQAVINQPKSSQELDRVQSDHKSDERSAEVSETSMSQTSESETSSVALKIKSNSPSLKTKSLSPNKSSKSLVIEKGKTKTIAKIPLKSKRAPLGKAQSGASLKAKKKTPILKPKMNVIGKHASEMPTQKSISTIQSTQAIQPAIVSVL